MSNPSLKKRILFVGVILVLVLIMIYSGLQILESTVFNQNPGETPTFVSKTIVRDGVSYFPRQDITTLLIMGIDELGPVAESTTFNAAGAADMVALLIFDQTNQETRLLVLNRDTMLKMPVLGIGGKKAGSYYGQLALSHTFGSGLEDSCENTRDTVSQFLYGVHIDYYFAMNMDAIKILNDAVGGVTVTVKDDFSSIDPTITMGEVTLFGQQALNFVRTRHGLSDQMNISRMERHREYMTGFLEAMQAKKDDPSFAIDTYNQAAPYFVSDCSATVMNDILQRYGNYPLEEIVSPKGENVLADYYEFYVDEEDLDQLILRLLYAPKE